MKNHDPLSQILEDFIYYFSLFIRELEVIRGIRIGGGRWQAWSN